MSLFQTKSVWFSRSASFTASFRVQPTCMQSHVICAYCPRLPCWCSAQNGVGTRGAGVPVLWGEPQNGSQRSTDLLYISTLGGEVIGLLEQGCCRNAVSYCFSLLLPPSPWSLCPGPQPHSLDLHFSMKKQYTCKTSLSDSAF
jgi:hypothetical protein